MTTLLQKRRLSWRKRLLFSAIILVCGVGLLELLSWIGLVLIGSGRLNEVVQERQQYQAEEEQISVREAVHPYLGWVLNPHASEQFEGRTYPVNDFGLLDTHSPLQKRTPDKVIVGVIGGSVAWQTSAGGNESLLRELRRQPRFQGRDVVLVRLAMNGYKQPQQLLLLTYLLSLGAELDVLINIDGYNEVALHPVENGAHRIFPAYPRAWKARNELLTDPQNLPVVSRYTQNKSRRRAWAGWCSKLPWQTSYTLNFVWKARDNLILRSLHSDLSTLLQARIGRRTYQITGPQQSFRTDDEMVQYLVQYWQNCSRQMDLICRANGIDYYHMLPPNQHLADSKPLGPQEREIALRPSPYQEPAQRAYPLLVRQGVALQREGVQFYDLSQLFKAHSEPIYVDDCCHYNPAGNELLAIAIARIVGRKESK